MVLKFVCSFIIVSWFYISLNKDYNIIDCEEKMFSFSKNDCMVICIFLLERNGKLYIIYLIMLKYKGIVIIIKNCIKLLLGWYLYKYN